MGSRLADRYARFHVKLHTLGAILCWAIVLGACGLPLGQLFWTVATSDVVWRSALPGDVVRRETILRTVVLNGCAATLATAFAIVPGAYLGLARRSFSTALFWLVLPASILLPSIVMTYGWAQVLALVHLTPRPASALDLARCVTSLAAWTWPACAIVIAMWASRVERSMLAQARLDGARTRLTLRLLLPAVLLAWAVAFLLAMQEFAVYEPTGVRVISVDVRAAWDTGMDLAGNPIVRGADSIGADDRLVAALVTALPGVVIALAVAVLLLLAAAWTARDFSLSDSTESTERLPRRVAVLAWLTPFVALGVPVVALALSINRSFDLGYIVREYSSQVLGSALLGVSVGVVAALLGVASLFVRSRGPIVVAMLAFLVGGQVIAIGLIRLFNRDFTAWVYDGIAINAIGCLARFAWIALLVALATRGRGWMWLREMAAIDGASPARTALGIVLPIVASAIAGSALLVALLSMTEVPASVLLSTGDTLIPQLMGWVHTANFAPMIEASLLLVATVLLLGTIATLLVGRVQSRLAKLAPCVLVLLLLNGCDRDASRADAIWLSVGRQQGEVVYPRAIAYDARNDWFYVIDRNARVQRIDSTGKSLNVWDTPEYLNGKPTGCTVGPDGNLWVADTHYYRVLVYTPDGKLVKQFGKQGDVLGDFRWPTDIAFDSAGRVYVSEYNGNDRITVFSPDLKPLFAFGKLGEAKGEFSRPQALVVVDDELFVVDACNHRIQVFTLDGAYKRTLGKLGSGPGEFRFPWGIDVDAEKNLVVVEYGGTRVQRITRDGKPLTTWGRNGKAPGELLYPWGVAVDRAGRSVVIDSGNNRLQVIRW